MNDLGLGIIVSLKDAFTQNASRIQSSMQTLDASVEAASENMTRNLGLIEKGAMMTGAGLALLAIPAGLVASTAATQKALGELASVGVKDFRAMEDAAESFTNQWAGTNKAEFITAAYDVKSALASLSDQAVGTFAAMAALTAKATKATTQEMVETFTTGYGIFKPLARDMPDMEWAKMFSGALSQTVGVFKTTGPQMAEAIKNIGAIAAASNVPLQEQLAVLGQLQTTMPGSEAGTLYKAFMMKVAEAGDELGLSFVDASGTLKGIVPILEEVKRKFPDLSQAAVQVQLKKAFGSDEAVRFLLQMSAGLDQLEGNIKSVGQAMKGGTAVTLEMAQAMNMDIGSQYGLVKQQLTNLFEILGRTFLPVVIPVFQGISRLILYLQGVAKSAPGVTRVILTLCAALGLILVVGGSVISAIGTIGILLPAIKVGLAALGPMLAGVGTAVSTYFWLAVAIIAAVVVAVIALKKAWETNFAGIRDIVLGVGMRISLVFQGVWALISSLRGGSGQMSAELHEKLQATGLLKFVTTVFQVYYRVREFLTGLWQAFSSVFGKVQMILEPAVRALMGAFGELGKALGSVFAAFGMASTAVDASSFKSFGQTLGTILGTIAQVAAYVIKFVVYPLSWVIRVVAAVAQAALWFGKTFISALITAVPYIYRFSLPLRMLAGSLRMVGRVASALWRTIAGSISRVNFTQAGRRILITLSQGIRSAVAYPFEILKRALGWLRRLLPFSDAQEGPLSSLSASGAAIPRTLAQGMLSVISLPAQALSAVLRAMLSAANWVWDEMRALGSGLVSTISGAFSQIGSFAGSVWSRVRGSAASAWSSIGSMASSAAGRLRAPFSALASGASSAWSVVRGAASNAFSYILSSSSNLVSAAFQSGRSVMTTIASGIRSAVAAPYEAAKSALSRLRRLLPFSDAQEGPLSTLTRSGAAMLEAFSAGIARASELPARALHSSLGVARNLMSVGLPASALAATLALTPVVAGDVPSIAAAEPVGGTVERSRLLAVTRGSLASERTPGAVASSEDIRPILEAILAKLDGLTERPIEVSVTTKLDGRQIARAVYKDMREQKVKNMC